MTNVQMKYIKSLDITQLLELLEDTIKHSYNCPLEQNNFICNCTNNNKWRYKYNSSIIKKEIISLTSIN